MEVISYLDELKECVSVEGVIDVMRDKTFQDSDQSSFLAPSIIFKAKRHDFKDEVINLPVDGSLAIGLRLVAYMKLDGKIGEVPVSGGAAELLARIRAMHNSFQEYAQENDYEFGEISLLTSEFLTGWILWKKDQESVKAHTDKVKWSSVNAILRGLKLWMNVNSLMPYPLRLPNELFINSNGFKKMVAGSKKERVCYEEEGGDEPPYPLELMKAVVSHALDYIYDYTDEILPLAKAYIKILKSGIKYSDKKALLLLREHKILFMEPVLASTQRHCRRKKARNNGWSINPELPGVGPSGAIRQALETLQTSCIIVVLLLTAMRKGELHSLYRFPYEKEEAPFLVDEAMKLCRMVYKTSKCKEGEHLEMPVPPIVVQALGILSELSALIDGKQDGMLLFKSVRYLDSRETDARINNLLASFCDRFDIPYPPHPHSFRHAMAFILSYFNDSNGTELAMRFLGHKSIAMTRQYLKHYRLLLAKAKGIMIESNTNFKEANEEYELEASVVHAKTIQENLEENKKIYGGLVNRFGGTIHGSAKTIFTRGMVEMAKDRQVIILRAPTNMCVRFVGDGIERGCQMGLTDETLVSSLTIDEDEVIPARCVGSTCGCSVYLESDLAALADSSDSSLSEFPEEIQQRLSKNTLFIADRVESSNAKMLRQYRKNQIEKEA